MMKHLCILHISAYISAYFLHIRLIQSKQLHFFFCIFLAYYWQKPAYLKQIIAHLLHI